MKRIPTIELSLIACALFLPAVLVAQTRQAPSGDRVLVLTTHQSTQRRDAASVSKIMPASKAAEANRTNADAQIEGRARLEGNYLIIDFTAPFPDKSQKLVIASNLALDDIGGQCTQIKAGTYAVSRTRSTNGTVRLPVTPKNPAGRHRPWHGWFHTRCTYCCGHW
jgi:hypothetical protein